MLVRLEVEFHVVKSFTGPIPIRKGMQDRLSYVVVKVCGAPDMGSYSGKAVVVRNSDNLTLQSAA